MSVGLDLVTTPTSLIFHRELTPSPPAIPLMIDGARVLAQLFAFLLPASLFVHTLCLAVSCPAVGMVFMLGTFFVIHIAETYVCFWQPWWENQLPLVGLSCVR